MRVARGHGPGPVDFLRNGPGSGRPKLPRAARGTKDEEKIADLTIRFHRLPAFHISSCSPINVISMPNRLNL